jgi:peptidyl-prolyl cis-trans isomerase D
MVEQLLTLSYEQPDSLTAAAEELALEVKTTSWVTEKHGEGLAADSKIRQVAFSEEVLKQGRNSDLVELADGHVVVLRIEQHEDAKPKTLEEVDEEIRSAIANDKARGRAATQGKQAVDELRSGSDISVEAKKINAQLQEPGLINRENKQVSEPILNKAFVIKKPVEGAISVGGVQLVNGDYAVIVLRSIQENPQIDEDKETLVKQQAVEYGSRELEAVFKTLETGADIRIMRENLEDR